MTPFPLIVSRPSPPSGAFFSPQNVEPLIGFLPPSLSRDDSATAAPSNKRGTFFAHFLSKVRDKILRRGSELKHLNPPQPQRSVGLGICDIVTIYRLA